MGGSLPFRHRYTMSFPYTGTVCSLSDFRELLFRGKDNPINRDTVVMENANPMAKIPIQMNITLKGRFFISARITPYEDQPFIPVTLIAPPTQAHFTRFQAS